VVRGGHRLAYIKCASVLEIYKLFRTDLRIQREFWLIPSSQRIIVAAKRALLTSFTAIANYSTTTDAIVMESQ
jgi:hypothetical protein